MIWHATANLQKPQTLLTFQFATHGEIMKSVIFSPQRRLYILFTLFVGFFCSAVNSHQSAFDKRGKYLFSESIKRFQGPRAKAEKQ